jgi:ribosomal protein L31
MGKLDHDEFTLKFCNETEIRVIYDNYIKAMTTSNQSLLRSAKRNNYEEAMITVQFWKNAHPFYGRQLSISTQLLKGGYRMTHNNYLKSMQ